MIWKRQVLGLPVSYNLYNMIVWRLLYNALHNAYGAMRVVTCW